MARKAIPKNETPEQTRERKVLDYFANLPSRAAKTSWGKKMDQLVKILAEVTPIEDKIHDLIAEKQVHLDKIQELRLTMVDSCIHPKEHLVVEGNYVVCKFCNAKLGIPSDVG